jgi:hypothetical protein
VMEKVKIGISLSLPVCLSVCLISPSACVSLVPINLTELVCLCLQQGLGKAKDS